MNLIKPEFNGIWTLLSTRQKHIKFEFQMQKHNEAVRFNFGKHSLANEVRVKL